MGGDEQGRQPSWSHIVEALTLSLHEILTIRLYVSGSGGPLPQLFGATVMGSAFGVR